MTWYRAKYDTSDQKYKIGARLKVIGESMGATVQRNRQGDSVQYAGRFSSTESITRGSVVVMKDNTGRMYSFKIGPISYGMGNIRVYWLEEDGSI